MTVWAVFESDYEGNFLYSLWTTQAAAEAELDVLSEQHNGGSLGYYVEEIEVQE